MNFREALLEMAESDQVTPQQARKLKRVANNNRRLIRVEERCELEARRQGKRLKPLAGGGGYGDKDRYGFDWSTLLKQLFAALLPIILSFLESLN
jgi:hypothetical protein